MKRSTCSLLASIAIAWPFLLSVAQPPVEKEDAQPRSERKDLAARSPVLCPMPVVAPRDEQTIRTMRPNPGIEYSIHSAPTRCHNPLFMPAEAPKLAFVPNDSAKSGERRLAEELPSAEVSARRAMPLPASRRADGAAIGMPQSR